MNGYVVFYNGKRHELYAASLYAAKEAAIAHFKVPPRKSHMVSGILAEVNGKSVTTTLDN